MLVVRYYVCYLSEKRSRYEKCISFVFPATVAVLASGCSATIPTDSYTPQNFVRYQHQNNVFVGNFSYLPETDPKLKLKPNQIQNTAMGTIYISTNVADLVRRATALELEKTGMFLSDKASIIISGDVLEFKANDLGYSIHWTYGIRYRISDKLTGQSLYAKEFRPEMKKTGKFGTASDYAPVVHEIVLNGYDMFIRDDEVRKILDVANDEGTAVPKSPK